MNFFTLAYKLWTESPENPPIWKCLLVSWMVTRNLPWRPCKMGGEVLDTEAEELGDPQQHPGARE